MTAATERRLVALLERQLSPEEIAPIVEIVQESDHRAWSAGYSTGFSAGIKSATEGSVARVEALAHIAEVRP